MTANTNPIFTLTPNVGKVAISTANANRDGTGTIGTVFTAGANGSRIGKVVIKASGTTTAGMVRLFLHDGATYYLFKEIAVSAITPGATTASFVSILTGNPIDPTSVNGADEFPIVLPTGWSLRASTHNAESFNVEAFGGDF